MTVATASFTVFSNAVRDRYNELSKGELFVTDVQDLFDKYISFWPEGTNPVFRTNTYYHCQTCRQFIKNLGRVVAISNNQIITVWGGLCLPGEYGVVADQMDALLKACSIVSVFRTKEKRYGTDHNYDNKTDERYDHFSASVAHKHFNLQPDTVRAEFDAIYQVMKRGLTEIKQSDISTVLDLIEQNQLYRGEEHKPAIIGFRDLLMKYNACSRNDLFLWENLNNRNARFRNTVIGTLLTDLAEGKDVEDAVKLFESKVAPQNYKRTTSVITQRMVEDAVQKMNDLGLGGAIYRRYAKLSDVSVNDVLFVNNDTRSKMKDGVAAILESSIKQPETNIKHAQSLTPDEFIENVLPKATHIELLLENRHVGNFVSLTGSDGPERLFKWNNNFAWAYDGDVTDSVKQRVKAAGGNIHADLRVSLSWFNYDDLDLHAITPNGQHIYYADKRGVLDVDMNAGGGQTRTPVENLAFMRPHDGVYKVSVNQFNRRETTDFGFNIEVECRGLLHQYSLNRAMNVKETVPCFELTMKNGELVDIKTTLKGGSFSQEKWGVKTQTLVPVASIMFSPNHWGENKIGARHMIFSLEGCVNPGEVRGIFNEYLRSDLEKHRKVFEVLGAKTKCKWANDQISGVGFTAARGDSVTVVVDGRRAYCLSF